MMGGHTAEFEAETLEDALHQFGKRNEEMVFAGLHFTFLEMLQHHNHIKCIARWRK